MSLRIACVIACLSGCVAESSGNPTPVPSEDAGAADASDSPDTGAPDTGIARAHPEGYAGVTVHGLELKTGVQDCRACHGADLTGGVAPSGGAAPSCDGCHTPGWRTQCNFCHGSTTDPSGAPPRDLRNHLLREEMSFRPHGEHVSVGNHGAYDCTQCHAKPTDVLSVGHIFDDTPGVAEVTFENGLSQGGNYDGGGSCTSLYCHGNGRVAGAYTHERPQPTCDGCHAGPTATNRWATLSGPHRDHLRRQVACNECHSRTVDAQQLILTPGVHVNGMVDIDFASGQVTRTNGTCNGTCHAERHVARTW